MSEPAPSPQLLANLVRFGRVLRGLGLPVTAVEMATLASALGVVDVGQRPEVRNAARAILVSRREHLAVFERAFDLFFRAGLDAAPGIDLGELARRGVQREKRRALAAAPAAGAEGQDLPEGSETVIEAQRAWSDREVLARKDFAELTPEEVAEVRRLLRTEVLVLAPRRTRRREPARRGPYPDLRRAVRRSLRYGGEPLRLFYRRARRRPRPLVVLCDVSGSMEPYSRLLLELAWTLAATSERCEAFVFGTRLTRITRELADRDVDAALARAAAAVTDWGGGTRIGEALKVFNYDWGRRVLGRGAVVLVISDGWDRGDVDLLEREVVRLRRCADRVLWLNPLLGSPGYEPRTRGILAILPHVDDFRPAHNLESLRDLARVLAGLGERERGIHA